MKTMLHAMFILCICLLPLGMQAQNKTISQLEKQLQKHDLINIHTLDSSILVELKYATTDNFTHIVLYDTLSNAYLHPIAAQKLVKAQHLLKQINPNYSLIVYDAARPLSVQQRMYQSVQGTSKALYVAHPDRRGLHNFGMAVDLSICDMYEYNRPLDMGTPFDHLGREAHIDTEDDMIRRGVLTWQQVKNRRLLRKVMVEAGFRSIRGEWWHFNAVSLSEAWASYKVIK